LKLRRGRGSSGADANGDRRNKKHGNGAGAARGRGGREINSQDCEAERGAKRSTGRGAELSQSDNDSNGADQRRTIQARNVRCSR
jgi:hypothetical protein